jgi:hypothetical protein
MIRFRLQNDWKRKESAQLHGAELALFADGGARRVVLALYLRVGKVALFRVEVNLAPWIKGLFFRLFGLGFSLYSTKPR